MIRSLLNLALEPLWLALAPLVVALAVLRWLLRGPPPVEHHPW